MVTEYLPPRSRINIPQLQVPLGSNYIGVVEPKPERHTTRSVQPMDLQLVEPGYSTSLQRHRVGLFGLWQILVSFDQRSTPYKNVSDAFKQLSKIHLWEQGHFLDTFISAFDSVGEEDWKKLPRNASSRVDKVVYDDPR